MKKLVLLAFAGAGYVLGARAGRERYVQIKKAASSVRRNPQVQSVVDDLRTEATHVAREATHKVTDAVRRGGSDDSASADDHLPPPGSTS